MATTITTDYMLLVLPVPGQAPGPAWAAALNAALVAIDRHNHSPDRGSPVPSSGININAALLFNGQDAVLVRSLRLSNQAAALGGATDVGCIYEAGGDLWWNSANGDQVQLTSGAALNAASIGAIGGDYASTPGASLFFTAASKKYTFRSAANTPGALDGGPVTLRTLTTSPNGITLNSPSGLAADYGLTLPAGLPAGTRLFTVDSSGNIAAADTALGKALTLSDGLTVGGDLTLNKVGDQAISKTGSGKLVVGSPAGSDLEVDFVRNGSTAMAIGADGCAYFAGKKIRNIADPLVATDGATKGYADTPVDWTIEWSTGWSGAYENRVSKHGGMVTIALSVQRTLGGSGVIPFILPVGYRPLYAIEGRAHDMSSGVVGPGFFIYTNGNIILSSVTDSVIYCINYTFRAA